jgi:hypothetical protein
MLDGGITVIFRPFGSAKTFRAELDPTLTAREVVAHLQRVLGDDGRPWLPPADGYTLVPDRTRSFIGDDEALADAGVADGDVVTVELEYVRSWLRRSCRSRRRTRGREAHDPGRRDGHQCQRPEDLRAPGVAAAAAKLSTHAIDVVILGELERPADAPGLLREVRAGQLHPRVHPGQPVVTIWGADEYSALRAYDAGGDHHLPARPPATSSSAPSSALVARHTFEPVAREQLQVGPLRMDVAARTVDVDGGSALRLTRREFELCAASPATRRACSARTSSSAPSGVGPAWWARALSTVTSIECAKS